MKNIFILTIALVGQSAIAGPIYSSNCPVAREIDNPPGATGFYMSEDCRTAYVLPPTRGITTVIGHTSGNLARCSEVGAFNKNLRKINFEINKVVGSEGGEVKLKELYDQRKQTIEQYSDLSKTQGAAVELGFSIGIGENLKAYQEYNPNANVSFQAVQLKDMKLAWNQVENVDPEMKIAFNQSIPLPTVDSFGAGSFNSRLDLSLFGACPLRDPFTGVLPKKLKAKNLAGLITPNVVYNYEIGATFTYKASYNLSALASKIKKKSTKGGMFKTSSMSKLLEKEESEGWFKFEMSCDDSRVCEQATTETSNSIKLRLMKEVFDQIALTTLGTIPLDPAAKPGASGAQTAAEGLRKCPNVYCQAAAVVLDVAQSIFGGTSATETYIKTHDHWAIEEVKEHRPVSIVGMMGFGE